MLPPLTVQFTWIFAVSPTGVKATAVSRVAPPVGSVTDLGVICRRIVAVESVRATGFSQPRAARATTSHASFSKANRTDNLCLNVMTGFPQLGRFAAPQRTPSGLMDLSATVRRLYWEARARAGRSAPAATWTAHARRLSASLCSAPDAWPA